MTEIGGADGLGFTIRWSPNDAHLARGTLTASVKGMSIWQDEEGDGLGWTWIELLEHLSAAWPFLKYEEAVPSELDNRDATHFLLAGRLLHDYDGFQYLGRVSNELFVFSRRHNLATGLDGLFLPSLAVLKEGLSYWVISDAGTHLLPAKESLHVLEQLGDAIAKHLATNKDSRSESAVSAWQRREPDNETKIRLLLGSDKTLKQLVPANESLAEYFEIEGDRLDESPVLAAARMSAIAPVEVQQAIIRLIRSSLPSRTHRQVEISKGAKAAVPTQALKPHAQGQEVALWLRKEFRVADGAKADPYEVLRKMGVPVHVTNLKTELIDAFGCWSARHGPAIYVNETGQHAQSFQGRRATVAHELAHILLDQDGSLPAAEVFGGRSSWFAEARANAFAAEFLIPREIAARGLLGAEDRVAALTQMLSTYDVSREILAWQVRNSSAYPQLDDAEKSRVQSWTRGGEGFFIA